MLLTSICFSLFLSLPLSLKSINISSGDDLKKYLLPESTSLLEPTHGRVRMKWSLSPTCPGVLRGRCCGPIIVREMRPRNTWPEVPGGSHVCPVPGYRAGHQLRTIWSTCAGEARRILPRHPERNQPPECQESRVGLC